MRTGSVVLVAAAALVILTGVVGCDGAARSTERYVSTQPALGPDARSRGDGPWQVMAEGGLPVTFQDKRVFLSAGSQFIYASGEAITNPHGKPVFLNKDGLVVEANGRYIPSNHIFDINRKRPLPRSVGIYLKGF